MWWFLTVYGTKPPQQPVKLQCWMFPKLNDFVQAQLVLSTCWKHFCLKCWRCSGLLGALEAGLALREAGAQAEELTAQWGICCPVRLASAPAACWQYLALGRYLWVGGCPMSFCSPHQPCAPEGCFWMSIEWAAWATCPVLHTREWLGCGKSQ